MRKTSTKRCAAMPSEREPQPQASALSKPQIETAAQPQPQAEAATQLQASTPKAPAEAAAQPQPQSSAQSRTYATKPLSYVIFSALYAPHTGGVESYTAGLANELAKRGHRVAIATCRLSSDHPEREIQPNGVTILRLPCRPLLNGRLPLLRRNKTTRRILEELAESKPDRVIVNTRFYGLSLEGARFAAQARVPAFIIEHGSAHLSLGNPLLDKFVEAYEHHATRRIVSCGHPFCGVSASAATWLSHFGIQARGAAPNAIDLCAFAQQASSRNFRTELALPPDAFLVAFVGRLVPEKGIDALLQAAHELAEQPNLKPMEFVIAGDGPLAASVQKCGHNVHAVGSLSSPDVAALLRDANIVCLPSRSEGFATILLEAAAMSTAPLVTPVGGVEELNIKQNRGIVIEDAQPHTLVLALREAFLHREECTRQGELLHKGALQSTGWSQTADKLEALFNAYEQESTHS